MPQIPSNIFSLFLLKGKVVSITGSSNGIKLAVADVYAQAGTNITIWYNSTPADEIAEGLSQTYNITAKVYKCSVGSFEEVQKNNRSDN